MAEYFSPFTRTDVFPEEEFLPHAKPLWLTKDSSPKSSIILCLHGFTATCYEASVVAKAIFKQGMDAACLLFPAHGIKSIPVAKLAMAKLLFPRLLEVVRTDIVKARSLYDHVYIYGQSMGGTVALRMAEEGLVDGCATTAPAITLPSKGRLAAKFLGWLNFNQTKNEEIPYFNESYPFFNTKSIRQLHLLAKLVTKDLHQIQCPVLVCHSKKDLDIDPVITQWISNSVQGPVSIEWFNESGHTMPLDVQGSEVCATIASFFENMTEMK